MKSSYMALPWTPLSYSKRIEVECLPFLSVSRSALSAPSRAFLLVLLSPNNKYTSLLFFLSFNGTFFLYIYNSSILALHSEF